MTATWWGHCQWHNPRTLICLMNLKYEFNFNNNNLQAPLDILRRMDYNWLKSSLPIAKHHRRRLFQSDEPLNDVATMTNPVNCDQVDDAKVVTLLALRLAWAGHHHHIHLSTNGTQPLAGICACHFSCIYFPTPLRSHCYSTGHASSLITSITHFYPRYGSKLYRAAKGESVVVIFSRSVIERWIGGYF